MLRAKAQIEKAGRGQALLNYVACTSATFGAFGVVFGAKSGYLFDDK
jgi:hypothetical protein